MSDSSRLTLKEVLRSGESKAQRLQEFIEQEQRRGVPSADLEEFDTAVTKLATQPPPKDRTSRSTSGGGSNEK